jgi:hypothetical protein
MNLSKNSKTTKTGERRKKSHLGRFEFLLGASESPDPLPPLLDVAA